MELASKVERGESGDSRLQQAGTSGVREGLEGDVVVEDGFGCK